MIRAVGKGDELRFEVYKNGRYVGMAADLQAATWIDNGCPPAGPRLPVEDDIVERGRSLEDWDTAALCDWIAEAADLIEALRWARMGFDAVTSRMRQEIAAANATIDNLRAEVANAREHRP